MGKAKAIYLTDDFERISKHHYHSHSKDEKKLLKSFDLLFCIPVSAGGYTFIGCNYYRHKAWKAKIDANTLAAAIGEKCKGHRVML